MRLLIIGGSSYLGRHLVPIAAQSHQLLYSWWRTPVALPGEGIQLNVQDTAAVAKLCRSWQPDAIIHLAGSNRPIEQMRETIETGTAAIVAAAPNCRLIHFSTDVLFDGRDAPYHESDAPSPLHAYGAAKAASELIASTHPNAVIIRTSLIYSLTAMDRGTEWMAEALKNGETITLFTNQLRQPVWAETLAYACLELLHLPYRGILHVAGNQAVTRADFAKRMLRWWGIDAHEQIQEAPYLGDAHPLDCRLDLSRAQKLLQTALPGVDTVLAAQQSRDKRI